MSLHVIPDGPGQTKGRLILGHGGPVFRCALGRSGVSRTKQEGDGATPTGAFALRRVFYRPDRIVRPVTGLPVTALSPDMGWCDDPSHKHYNELIRFPFKGSAEHLWREDTLYDVIVVLGYNDRPVIKGRGSAIFMHVAARDFKPTEGCVALDCLDLQMLLRSCKANDHIVIA